MPYWTASTQALKRSRTAPWLSLRIGWRSAGLLGEFEIRVAGRIGLLHQGIAGQRRRNAKFLLAPIDIGESLAGLRFNQRPQPNRGAKDELRIGRLIAPGG